MLIHLLILNYNGRSLLAECLPSVLRAAEASRHRCDVVVIDNDSTDDSVDWLANCYPKVRVIRRPNRGLCSYNDVVASLPGRIAVLLNNDVKLDQNCLDPLVQPLLAEQSDFFMTAPRCYQFDEKSYEGFRTAVLWRLGLVQATALFRGHRRAIEWPSPTASSGAVMAIDCHKFVELGGFDPLYLPGRLEDLDLAFRGYMSGYCACYVPEALSWHQGMATFAERFGESGCDWLALRNTLLFECKNLRHPAHVARGLAGVAARLVIEVALTPWLPLERRWKLTGAMAAAWRQFCKTRVDSGALEQQTSSGPSFARPPGKLRREREFFRRFSPERMLAEPPRSTSGEFAHATAACSDTARSNGHAAKSTQQIPAEGAKTVCRSPLP